MEQRRADVTNNGLDANCEQRVADYHPYISSIGDGAPSTVYDATVLRLERRLDRIEKLLGPERSPRVADVPRSARGKAPMPIGAVLLRTTPIMPPESITHISKRLSPRGFPCKVTKPRACHTSSATTTTSSSKASAQGRAGQRDIAGSSLAQDIVAGRLDAGLHAPAGMIATESCCTASCDAGHPAPSFSSQGPNVTSPSSPSRGPHETSSSHSSLPTPHDWHLEPSRANDKVCKPSDDGIGTPHVETNVQPNQLDVQGGPSRGLSISSAQKVDGMSHFPTRLYNELSKSMFVFAILCLLMLLPPLYEWAFRAGSRLRQDIFPGMPLQVLMLDWLPLVLTAVAPALCLLLEAIRRILGTRLKLSAELYYPLRFEERVALSRVLIAVHAKSRMEGQARSKLVGQVSLFRHVAALFGCLLFLLVGLLIMRSWRDGSVFDHDDLGSGDYAIESEFMWSALRSKLFGATPIAGLLMSWLPLVLTAIVPCCCVLSRIFARHIDTPGQPNSEHKLRFGARTALRKALIAVRADVRMRTPSRIHIANSDVTDDTL